MNQYKRLERRTGYGSFLNMFIDTVQLPNEHIIELEFIDHPGAAAIVPVDEDGNIIMVRQFRYAASGYIYEIPAGKLGQWGSTGALCRPGASRGNRLSFRKTVPLDSFGQRLDLPMKGSGFYLARDLEACAQALEANEVFNCREDTSPPSHRRCQSSRISDGKTVCALLRGSPC